MENNTVGNNMKKSFFESLTTAINAMINVKNENNPTRNRKNYLAQQVLELVYKIGRAGSEFSEEERKVIGPLIKEIIPALDVFIFDYGMMFDPDYEQYNLILRSGIQFLLDNFKEFPVTDEEVLWDSLKEIKDSDSLETFHEDLINYKNNPATYLYLYLSHTKDESTRPQGVPETHNWWS